MLELLLYALFTPQSETFLNRLDIPTTPSIEKSFLPSAIPEKNPESIAPVLINDPDTAILSQDLDSGKILFEKNADRPQAIASLTKLMTILIILEYHSLDEIVTIPPEVQNIHDSVIKLEPGEKMTVGNLIEAGLISSANDAALSLAIFHSGSEEDFVKEMNAKARELNLNSAQFFNATGLDIILQQDENGKVLKSEDNMMSAFDLLKLSKILLTSNFVQNTVQKGSFKATSVDGTIAHEKPSTNQLLGGFLNISGFKTGYTEKAKECFISLASAPGNHKILTIIIGSNDRFGETKKLLSWIYDAFEWK